MRVLNRATTRPRSRPTAGAIGLALAAVVTLTLGSGEPAAAAPEPCRLVDESSVSRLLGPTSRPRATSVGALDACRLTIGSLTLEVIDGTGVVGEYEAQLASHGADDTQPVDDYADGAFFGWGVEGALDFVARLGQQVTIIRVFGEDPGRSFDAADPTANSEDNDVSGSEVGSAMWVLMTESFVRNGGVAIPTIDDLSGLWRTTDITPCAPSRDLGVRVSEFTTDGDSLRAEKVAGDACLENDAVDFEGTTSDRSGSGVSFGSTGSSSPTNGSAYRLVVDSPTRVTLTGAAGALQYTLEYERLSWPGLTNTVTSSLLGIPSPSEALTVKNVALTGALSAVLLLLVVFPTTLFNSALEANLDHYRAFAARIRDRLRHRFRRPGPPTAATGAAVPNSTVTTSRWRRPGGVAAYIVAAGLLFSLMQPSWGPNSATLISIIGFVGGVAIASVLSVAATVVYLLFSHRNGRGYAMVEPSTLALAGFFVLASRIVGFVPGYMYGVLVNWKSAHEPDDFDRGRIIAFNSSITLITAVVAWLLIPVCRDVAGSDPNVLEATPLSLIGGVFVSSVETLTIGLIPVHFLPGHTLRAHSLKAWQVLWLGGGLMFVLILLRPGLVSGASRNIIGTCALVAISSLFAIGFWAYERRRGQSASPTAGTTGTTGTTTVPGPGVPPPVPPELLPQHRPVQP